MHVTYGNKTLHGARSTAALAGARRQRSQTSRPQTTALGRLGAARSVPLLDAVEAKAVPWSASTAATPHFDAPWSAPVLQSARPGRLGLLPPPRKGAAAEEAAAAKHEAAEAMAANLQAGRRRPRGGRAAAMERSAAVRAWAAQTRHYGARSSRVEMAAALAEARAHRSAEIQPRVVLAAAATSAIGSLLGASVVPADGTRDPRNLAGLDAGFGPGSLGTSTDALAEASTANNLETVAYRDMLDAVYAPSQENGPITERVPYFMLLADAEDRLSDLQSNIHANKRGGGGVGDALDKQNLAFTFAKKRVMQTFARTLLRAWRRLIDEAHQADKLNDKHQAELRGKDAIITQLRERADKAAKNHSAQLRSHLDGMKSKFGSHAEFRRQATDELQHLLVRFPFLAKLLMGKRAGGVDAQTQTGEEDAVAGSVHTNDPELEFWTEMHCLMEKKALNDEIARAKHKPLGSFDDFLRQHCKDQKKQGKVKRWRYHYRYITGQLDYYQEVDRVSLVALVAGVVNSVTHHDSDSHIFFRALKALMPDTHEIAKVLDDKPPTQWLVRRAQAKAAVLGLTQPPVNLAAVLKRPQMEWKCKELLESVGEAAVLKLIDEVDTLPARDPAVNTDDLSTVGGGSVSGTAKEAASAASSAAKTAGKPGDYVDADQVLNLIMHCQHTAASHFLMVFSEELTLYKKLHIHQELELSQEDLFRLIDKATNIHTAGLSQAAARKLIMGVFDDISRQSRTDDPSTVVFNPIALARMLRKLNLGLNQHIVKARSDREAKKRRRAAKAEKTAEKAAAEEVKLAEAAEDDAAAEAMGYESGGSEV